MMRAIVVLILTLLLVTPAFAQLSPDAQDVFTPVAVTGVTLHLEDGNAYLIVSGNPASCDPVMIDQRQYELSTATVIEADLVTLVPPPGAVCNMLLPFTQRIELGKLLEDHFYVLAVNDFVGSVFVPRQDAIPMDIMAQIAVWNGELALEAHFRSDALIDDVDFSISENNTIVARIKGSHGDGCIFSTVAGVAQDRVDARLYRLEYYRVMPVAVMCPAMLQTIEDTIDTGLPADQAVVLAVGEMLFQYTPVNQQFVPIIRAYNRITGVTISVAADGYNVQVQAEQGGDCGAPLQQIVREAGYATYISVFNDVALDAACTRNIILHDLTFTVQQLPVVINGVAYHLEGDTGGASAVPAEDTSMIAVEHLIENVEVLVLESFPPQLVLRVSGMQPDGCEYPVQIVQQVEGNQVTVRIFREMPQDAICPMIAMMFNEEIRIDGTFSGGTVNIQVNQFMTSIDL